MNEAVRVTGMEDFDRRFGGLHRDSEASYAIQQYYLNGGQIAWVVRVAGGDAGRGAATASRPAARRRAASWSIDARQPRAVGKDHVQVAVDHQARDAARPTCSTSSCASSTPGRRAGRGVRGPPQRQHGSDEQPRYVKAVIAAESDADPDRRASATGGPPDAPTAHGRHRPGRVADAGRPDAVPRARRLARRRRHDHAR